MDILNYIIAPVLVILALLFFIMAFRRGEQAALSYDLSLGRTEQEILRDHFFTNFPVACGIFCIVPIIAPIRFWYFIIPIGFVVVFLYSCLATLGAYLQSFTGTILTSIARSRAIQDSSFWSPSSNTFAILAWYEFTPFTFIAGWVVYYLMYVGSAFIAKFDFASETAPT